MPESSKANAKSNALLVAPVNRTLLLMSAPISLGMLSTFLFQVVDTYFVGQLGGPELAALGFSATAYFLAVALFMGMAVGISSLVGNAMGQGDLHRARRYTTVALAVALAGAATLSALGLATLEPLFTALGADAALLPLIAEYMTVLYCGLPLLTIGIAGSAAIRATGDVKPPELVMGLAGVINLVLDYLLIFGHGPCPRLGLQGAALATVLSWGFVFVCIVIMLIRRRLLTFAAGDLRAEIVQLGSLSTPAIATQIMLPITAMFITMLAARSGPQVVAALGVATRIETLLLVGISSVSVALVPFISQNSGAQRGERVDGAIAFAGKAAFYWGAALLVILVAFAGPIARLFSSDPTIVRYTELYFYIVAGSYAPHGIVMVTSAIFNGVMLPRQSLRILLVKTFAFTVPLALIGALFGALGVFAAVALSNVLGFVYAARLMRKSLVETRSPLAGQRIVDAYLADWRALAQRVRQVMTARPS